MNNRNLLAGMTVAVLIAPSAAYADSFTMWARADDSTFMTKIVDAFNAGHADKVELQIVPTGELVQKYAVAAAGGSAPDALSLDLIYTPSFAAAGQLEDITDLAKSLPYFDALSKAHLSVGTYKDKIYGVPFSADASVLIWNKDLFAKAGLDPDKGPTNWAEIRADAEKVKTLGSDIYGFYFSGNCGGCNIFTFTPLIWASGGDIFADNGAKSTLNSPAVKDAVAFYQGMVKDGLVPEGAKTDPGANFFAAFATGKIGISPSGSFAIGALNSQYPNLHYGVTFLPGKDGNKSSFAGGDNFVVTKGTKKIELIKQFLDFAYSLPGQTLLAKNGSLPVRADIAKEALAGLDERYLIPAEAMNVGRTPYSVVFNDLINSPNGPWNTTLNNVFFSTPDAIDQGLADGQDAMQTIIDQAAQ
ncbi:ABC transporter substrate-binding protein [Oryzibacter oryziterrae]|uniref:ABC transporter substrate-binding protein n=1 Tax=Oryzibacter oryziterrae TaxID=2766474 RepID=UPI001F3E2C32|nr:sugar ABC transporter substrate-binding protein [Oryzibacter oryziterrae]